MKINLRIGLALVVAAGAGVAYWVQRGEQVDAATAMAPRFEVDPLWPKPLPNHWVTGSTIGVSVDSQDRVWTLHRPNTVEDNFKAADLKLGECCKAAPPVLVYDQAGDLVKSWGGPGPGYDWPDNNHGLTVDHKGNVWIGGNGTNDTQVLKFTGDGKFLLQLGKHGVHKGSNDIENFWQPTKIYEDVPANEVYISDGYGNRRVIVFDADTGKYKRHWGAYGKVPTDEKEPPYDPAALEDAAPAKRDQTSLKNFSTPHCVIVSKDGLVYICDRVNDRIQVFRKDGTFVKEVFIEPNTLRSGSVWDMEFSRDPEQTYIYAANGVNEKINVLQRSTLEVLTSFGDGGRGPGQFFGAHNLATDSKGNLYVTETYTGARVQRFLYKGVGPAERNQGVVRPKR
jgi:DNA-binding beta-propeller fold protein YncE